MPQTAKQQHSTEQRLRKASRKAGPLFTGTITEPDLPTNPAERVLAEAEQKAKQRKAGHK